MEPPLSHLGIDISKAKFHAALLKENKRAIVKEFRNDDSGFAELGEWLKQQQVEQVHACLEATSLYGHGVGTD